MKKQGEIVASARSQSAAEQIAVKAARTVQDKGGLAQVVFHTENGTIREERTYGKDPERHAG